MDLISAIKVLPTDTLVQTVNKVLKQPPQTEIAKNKVKRAANCCITVESLEFVVVQFSWYLWVALTHEFMVRLWSLYRFLLHQNNQNKDKFGEFISESLIEISMITEQRLVKPLK